MQTTPQITEESYGKLVAPKTIEIQRLLPGPIERVWDYLTKSELREQWLASGHMPQAQGAAFKMTWPLARFSGALPEGMPAEHTLDSRIAAYEPPRKVAFTWSDGSIVSFELAPAGNRVLLKMIHKDLSSRGMMVGICTGWHTHMDRLVAIVSGGKPDVFWDEWKARKSEYNTRLPPDA